MRKRNFTSLEVLAEQVRKAELQIFASKGRAEAREQNFWTNRTSPSKRVGLGSPLAACSMYGDLTCSVHTVNNFHCFVIIKRMYVFVSENHMLDWQWCQICYPLEIKLLLTDFFFFGGGGGDK